VVYVDATLPCGLEVSGEYEHEAPTGPTYSCGGTPGGTWVDDIAFLGVEGDGDWSEALCEHVGPGVARMCEALVGMGLPLPPRVSSWLMSHFEEDIMEALCEAGETWEPDYDEDARYDWD
jgi:hypothetical protein